MLSNESFGVKVRFGAIYSASKTKDYFLKNKMIAIGLCRLSELGNTGITWPENSNWWLARSTSEQFVFEIPKKFHHWILNDFLVTDFFSNDFPEIYLAYLLYQ